MLIGALFEKYWPALLIGAACIALAGSIYVKGHSDGSAAGEAAQKEAVFQQLKERNITDEKVQGMSDPKLCRAIGGVLVDNQCQ